MSRWSKTISRYKLFEDLKGQGIGNGHDIPVKFTGRLDHFPVYHRDRQTLIGYLNVSITESTGKNRGHRVFVQCEKCGTWVPFGRYGQHWTRKDHQ